MIRLRGRWRLCPGGGGSFAWLCVLGLLVVFGVELGWCVFLEG